MCRHIPPSHFRCWSDKFDGTSCDEVSDGWDNDNLFQHYGVAVPTFAERMQNMVDWTSNFYDYNSQGMFKLDPTITAPVSVPAITSSSCGDINPLASSYSSTGVDLMAFAAAGYTFPPKTPDGIEFDFYVVGTPKCPGWYWGGIGRVGGPGIVVNRVSGYEGHVLIHELGAFLSPAPSFPSASPTLCLSPPLANLPPPGRRAQPRPEPLQLS